MIFTNFFPRGRVDENNSFSLVNVDLFRVLFKCVINTASWTRMMHALNACTSAYSLGTCTNKYEYDRRVRDWNLINSSCKQLYIFWENPRFFFEKYRLRYILKKITMERSGIFCHRYLSIFWDMPRDSLMISERGSQVAVIIRGRKNNFSQIFLTRKLDRATFGSKSRRRRREEETEK